MKWLVIAAVLYMAAYASYVLTTLASHSRQARRLWLAVLGKKDDPEAIETAKSVVQTIPWFLLYLLSFLIFLIWITQEAKL